MFRTEKAKESQFEKIMVCLIFLKLKRKTKEENEGPYEG